MESRRFRDLIEGQWGRGRMLCVGLDPDWERIPASLKTRGGPERAAAEVVLEFNRAIIAATCDIAAAYKPQSAYYERWGAAGWEALKQTVEQLRRSAPQTPVILDAKRADMDRTNR